MALGLTLLVLMLLPALTSACGRGPTPLPKALSSPTTTLTPVPLPASTATKERPAQTLPIATQAKDPTSRPTSTVAPRTERLPAATAIPAQIKIPATSPATSFVGPALPQDAAILSLELASGQPSPGREFTLALKLEPRGPGISGVQFRLDFPQNWVEVLDIIPGTVLGPTPLEVIQTREEPGGFLYAAARRGKTPHNTLPGQVAALRMRVAEDAPPGVPLRVELREVLLADRDILKIEDVAVGRPLELLVTAAP